MVETTFFPKDLAYRFSTLLVVAGCYLFYEIRDNGCKYKAYAELYSTRF